MTDVPGATAWLAGCVTITGAPELEIASVRVATTLVTAPGKIVFRFHSRDLHMVLGPSKNGTPVRFKVKLNGAGPGDDHGADSTADGTGEVRQPRMYQLIRQKGQIKDMTLEIEFLDPGVEAFSFTFG